MERCLKNLTGDCRGCRAFNRGIRLIRAGVPYQEAIGDVKSRDCPPNQAPTVEPQINRSGELVAVKIEGEIITK